MTYSNERRGRGRRGDRRLMRLGLLLSCAALAGVAACGGREDAPAMDSVDTLIGSVRVPLVTPVGDQYRLRGALFEITRTNGALVSTLDSESEPDATSLRTELDSGPYQITLREGWSLERLGEAGGPVSAALLTANPQPFQIDNARVTDLVYSFTTDAGVVTFGSGEVSVSVDVASNAPATSCDLLDRSSCPAGLTCLFSGDGGRTYCAAPGSIATGSPCDSEQCVAGSQCLAIDPTPPGARSCARFCDPDRLGCGCRALAFDDEVGVCTDSNDNVTFGFTADNCSVTDHDIVTSDDRGGIAVTDDFVYYTGDGQTGRFDLDALSNPTSLGGRLDGIVSDLDSGALYSLSIDGSPFSSDFFSCGAGLGFSTLLELDPSDGAVQRSIELSSAVPYDCGVGVFAGSGFLLVATGLGVFEIDPNDGTVTSLGARPALFANSCESWAFWGVAERVDEDYRMLYASGSEILRTHLDGTSEVAASFLNLSDMCSFSVSKARARWYFHHEGGSQFGGFGETVGFCDALIE